MEQNSYNEMIFREACRYMLLPTASTGENNVLAAIKKQLLEDGIKEEDLGQFLKNEYGNWQDSLKLNPVLKRAVAAGITASSETYGKLIGDNYFILFIQLLKTDLLDFRKITTLLSHTHFIAMMAGDHRMSATKIVTLLKTIDHRLQFASWKDVRVILKVLKLIPDLTSDDVKKIYEEDVLLAEETFADSTLPECASRIGEIAAYLGIDSDVEEILTVLTSAEFKHDPYLQMLHFQCMIAGKYDHILSSLYEFNPRGQAAEQLFKNWENIVSTSNPYLNNAKAVTSLDKNWAISRKGSESKAAAKLVDLLEELDALGFTAAQELCSWIRRMLARYIQLEQTDVTPIPDVDAQTQIIVLESVSKGQTSTYGILEQRFVDVISSATLVEADGWRPRGLGDAVNSNNLSKKKLGDIDFQNVKSLEVTGYEAHGGKLNSFYVQGHLRTLARSLNARIPELQAIEDISKWKIKIRFIAYSFEAGLPEKTKINDIEITIEYISFRDLFSMVDEKTPTLAAAFSTHFTGVLNERRTPAFVRTKVLDLLNALPKR